VAWSVECARLELCLACGQLVLSCGVRCVVEAPTVRTKTPVPSLRAPTESQPDASEARQRGRGRGRGRGPRDAVGCRAVVSDAPTESERERSGAGAARDRRPGASSDGRGQNANDERTGRGPPATGLGSESGAAAGEPLGANAKEVCRAGGQKNERAQHTTR
jgi:hypothetical protein